MSMAFSSTIERRRAERPGGVDDVLLGPLVGPVGVADVGAVRRCAAVGMGDPDRLWQHVRVGEVMPDVVDRRDPRRCGRVQPALPAQRAEPPVPPGLVAEHGLVARARRVVVALDVDEQRAAGGDAEPPCRVDGLVGRLGALSGRPLVVRRDVGDERRVGAQRLATDPEREDVPASRRLGMDPGARQPLAEHRCARRRRCRRRRPSTETRCAARPWSTGSAQSRCRSPAPSAGPARGPLWASESRTVAGVDDAGLGVAVVW